MISTSERKILTQYLIDALGATTGLQELYLLL